MKIILMRHGQAESYRIPDNTRQLTDFGRNQAEETAKYILDNYTPEMFVVSPFDRAQQTLEAYRMLSPDTPVQVLDSITPEDNPSKGLEDLYQLAHKHNVNHLLVVCHMSIVANMVGLLVGKPAVPYALAEARVFECDAIAENIGNQVDGYVPRQS